MLSALQTAACNFALADLAMLVPATVMTATEYYAALNNSPATTPAQRGHIKTSQHAADVMLPGEPIKTDVHTPNYFNYQGKPIVLVTSDHTWFAVTALDFNCVQFLDALSANGNNFTRIYPGAHPVIRQCRLLSDVETFLAVEGNECADVALLGNDLRRAKRAFIGTDGFLREVAEAGNLLQRP
jgi:hypothetical protein